MPSPVMVLSLVDNSLLVYYTQWNQMSSLRRRVRPDCVYELTRFLCILWFFKFILYSRNYTIKWHILDWRSFKSRNWWKSTCYSSFCTGWCFSWCRQGIMADFCSLHAAQCCNQQISLDIVLANTCSRCMNFIQLIKFTWNMQSTVLVFAISKWTVQTGK